jgi:hypothetical protein
MNQAITVNATEDDIRKAHLRITQQAAASMQKRFAHIGIDPTIIARLSLLDMKSVMEEMSSSEPLKDDESPLCKYANSEEMEQCIRLQKIAFNLYHEMLKSKFMVQEPAAASFWKFMSQMPLCLSDMHVIVKVEAAEAGKQLDQYLIALARNKEEQEVLTKTPFSPEQWLDFLKQHPELQQRNVDHRPGKKRTIRWFRGALQKPEYDSDGIICKNADMTIPLPLPPEIHESSSTLGSKDDKPIYQTLLAQGALLLNCDAPMMDLMRGMLALFHLEDMWVEAIQEEVSVLFLSVAEDLVAETAGSESESDTKSEEPTRATHARDKLYSRYFFEHIQGRRAQASVNGVPAEIMERGNQIMDQIYSLATELQKIAWRNSRRSQENPPPIDLARCVHDHVRQLLRKPSLFMTQLAQDVLRCESVACAQLCYHEAEQKFQEYLRTDLGLQEKDAKEARSRLMMWAQSRFAKRQKEAVATMHAVESRAHEAAFIQNETNKLNEETKKQKARQKAKRKKKLKQRQATTCSKDDDDDDEEDSEESKGGDDGIHRSDTPPRTLSSEEKMERETPAAEKSPPDAPLDSPQTHPTEEHPPSTEKSAYVSTL